MINMQSPRNSVGFHADPVVIIHSSEVNGHSRRQKFIILTVIATLVLSALIIGTVLLAKSLRSRSENNTSSKMDSTPKYLVSFEPAISDQQRNILIEILKQSNSLSHISQTDEGAILIQGLLAFAESQKIFSVAIDLNFAMFYTITDFSSGEILSRHCVNNHDIRCFPNENLVPDQEVERIDLIQQERDIDCPPGFKGPDCIDCAEGRYGSKCEFECGDCGAGYCNEGITGDGQCICPEGFGGNCQECLPGRYGSDCQQVCACKKEWGMCDDGLEGTGKCTCINNHVIGDLCDRCDVGWTGADCTLAEGTVGLNAFNFCGNRPELVAITFDGWPTDQILKELDDSSLKATFFIRPGTASSTSCSLVQRSLERGHGIQLGGFNGEPMNAMTAQQIDLQLQASLQWIKNCAGPSSVSDINQFRPPLDIFDNGRARYVSESGFEVATFNIEGNVEYDVFALYGQLQALPAASSVLIRFDSSVYPIPLLPVLSKFLNEQFRPEINKKYVLTKECYVACTGGSGVCRTESLRTPGVFDTFQTITQY